MAPDCLVRFVFGATSHFDKVMGVDMIISKISRVIKRFAGEHEGATAVEFALIMPLLLLLYLGTVEGSRAISYDRRLTTIAASLGDLVARSDTTITQTNLSDYFLAAEAIITPYAAVGLKQVVTSVFVDAAGAATVSWSQGYNGGVAHNVDDVYVLPTELTSIALNGYVVVSEAFMTYDPITTYVFPSSLQLYKEYFHLPRFGEEIQLVAG